MSDHMKEAERLAQAYADAVLLGEGNDEALAALLAHIQRGAVLEGWKEATIAWEVCASIHREYAKKKDPFFTTRQADFVKHTEAARSALLAAAPAPDQFRDATKMMAEPADPDPLHLSRILHELAGAASLCWEPRPTGVFDSQLAIQFVEQALAEIRSRMTSAPSEVPMPEPVAYGIGNTAITGRTNRLMMVRIVVPLDDQYAGAGWHPLVLADEARTYGDAREAAGYARGLREMLDCRTCRNYTRDGCIQTAQCVDGDGYRRATPVRFWSAAMRGEAQP